MHLIQHDSLIQYGGWFLNVYNGQLFREMGIPVVREAWLIDSIERKEAQPLEAYDIASDIAVAGRGIPLDKMDESEEARETITAEVYFHQD